VKNNNNNNIKIKGFKPSDEIAGNYKAFYSFVGCAGLFCSISLKSKSILYNKHNLYNCTIIKKLAISVLFVFYVKTAILRYSYDYEFRSLLHAPNFTIIMHLY